MRAVAGEGECLHDAGGVAVAGKQRYLRAMRRQAGGMAFAVEAARGRFIWRGEDAEYGMLRLPRLHPHLPRRFPPRPAADLHK